jgi:hypothetical protein
MDQDAGAVFEKRSAVIPRYAESAARAPSQAASPAEGAGARLQKRWRAVLLYLDVVLVLIAAPVALSLGAPALGYAIGAGAWISQRILAHADRRWIRSATAPRTQLGLNLFEAFGRIWLLAGAIVLAGVAGGRADGLTAALLIFGAYSVAFAIKVLFDRPSSPHRREVVR